MISVVIPLYNKEKSIENTIQCVLNQSFHDFEIIIVDDGSTDRSSEIIKRVSDSRVRLISQKNSGVSAARNRGIEESRGELIAFLDADDIWSTDCLKTQHELALKYPECDVFAINYEFQNEYGETKSTQINKLPFDEFDGILSNYFEVASCSNPPLWTSAVMVRKSAIESVGGFPVGITSGEDLLTWARLACRYNIAFSRIPKAIYFTPTTGPTGKIPKDLMSVNDAVSVNLKKLMNEYPHKGIKRYLAFWYKMRASINLHFFNRIPSIKCAMVSIQYHQFSLAPWAIILLSCMPKALIKKFLR